MVRDFFKRFKRGSKSEEKKSKTNWYKATVIPDVPISENEYEQEIAKLTAGEDGMPRYKALGEVKKNERYSCLEGFCYGVSDRLDVEAESIEDAKEKIISASNEKFDEKDEKSKIETLLGFKFGDLEEVLKSVKE